MLRTVAPFVAGFAASYAGHLGPQGWIFLTGLSAGFGAGYWFARSEGEPTEINHVVEEEVKPSNELDITKVVEEIVSKPLVENEDIQPYDSDNTDEFYSAVGDLQTAGFAASMKTKTSSLPVPNNISGDYDVGYTTSDDIAKISEIVNNVGCQNITKDITIKT